MPYSATATHETQTRLSEAVDAGDFEAFNAIYVAFLQQFESFRQAYSTTPSEMPARNALFGRNGFYLTRTDDVAAVRLLGQSRASSRDLATLSLAARLELLAFLEAEIERYRDAIITAIVADTGKPIDLAAGEMAKGQEWFAFARAQLAAQLAPNVSGKLTNSFHPRGAVQVISAYNYPFALAIGGIVGAIGGGNGVIVTTALKAPNWIFPFMEAAQAALDAFAASYPALELGGLIQHSIGINHFLTSAVDLVHFVGNDTVGASIQLSRGLKPTILELSGSNMVAVLSSALNHQSADAIARTIYDGFGPATGQRCTAPRLLCAEEGAREVLGALTARVASAQTQAEMGNPFRSGIKIGPLVDRQARHDMKQAMDLATELGARIYGALSPSDPTLALSQNSATCWVCPVVIDWSTAALDQSERREQVYRCLREEIFGPLLHILPAISGLPEAIALTNQLDRHKLAASVFSADAEDAARFQQATGITSVSHNAAPKDRSPFGAHGHPFLGSIIGGDAHFTLYTSRVTVAQA